MSITRKQVELTFKASNLKNADLFGKSDPVLYVEIRNGGCTEPWRSLGHTEVVMNNLNPTWCTGFVVDHLVGEHQDVRVTVQDYDSKNRDGTIKGDPLGSVEMSLDDITKTGHHGLSLALTGSGSKAGAMIHVLWEDASCAIRGTVVLTLKGTNLANRDGLFSKSDPFWSISKRRPDGVWVQVAKSEVVMNDLNPTWKALEIDLQHLCNGDMHRELKLEIMHKEKDDKSIEIGHQDLNVTAEILTKAGSMISLKHPDGKDKAVGTVTVVNAQVKSQHTFEGFVKGGLEVNLIAAVDLTGSNGDPSTPSSLHYHSAGMTPYQVAITSLSRVLAPYDSDGKITMFGFGAQPKRGAAVSHCFALNGNEAAPEVNGIDGMNAAYNAVLKTCELCGPTYAAEVIKKAITMATTAGKRVTGPLSYLMLLLLTDGDIDDMPETMNALVAASNVPLSVFIVGIGSCSFDHLKPLNGDALLKGSSGTASRSVCQFMRMDDYGAGAASRLAAKVMEKLPSQVEEYFSKAGIAPGKK